MARKTGELTETVINDFYPKEIIGGIGQILAIYGLGFGKEQNKNYISFIQDSGQYLDPTSSLALKYHKWSNTMIEVEMPVANSGLYHLNIGGNDYTHKVELKVKANLGYLNPNPLKYRYLNNQNHSGGHTWFIHETYWNNQEIKSAIEDVFRTIRRQTGVNFVLSKSPTHVSPDDPSPINIIGPLPSLTIPAHLYVWWWDDYSTGHHFSYLTSFKAAFSATENWYYGNGSPNGQPKFRYALLHELGHAVGLGHVNDIGQTMFPSITLEPSSTWNARDEFTTEEVVAMKNYVKASQSFIERVNGVEPLESILDINDIYEI